MLIPNATLTRNGYRRPAATPPARRSTLAGTSSETDLGPMNQRPLSSRSSNATLVERRLPSSSTSVALIRRRPSSTTRNRLGRVRLTPFTSAQPRLGLTFRRRATLPPGRRVTRSRARTDGRQPLRRWAAGGPGQASIVAIPSSPKPRSRRPSPPTRATREPGLPAVSRPATSTRPSGSDAAVLAVDASGSPFTAMSRATPPSPKAGSRAPLARKRRSRGLQHPQLEPTPSRSAASPATTIPPSGWMARSLAHKLPGPGDAAAKPPEPKPASRAPSSEKRAATMWLATVPAASQPRGAEASAVSTGRAPGWGMVTSPLPPPKAGS